MLLPIVERELRVAARQAGSYRLRFWTVAATISIGALILFSSAKGTQPHELAQTLFIAFGLLGLCFSMLSGLFLTADCLSVEKREQTLGLLFLTDLKGYDVVLGKLATTSLQAVYALLGLFPVLAVPLLMGGVTGGEVVRLILVLLATMFFSLAAGMLVSALSRESRQATLGTLAALIVICGILPLLFQVGRIFLKVKILKSVLLFPCPVYTFIKGLDEFYRSPGAQAEFWTSLSVVSALGLAFLTWACVLSSRIWQERTSEMAESKLTKKLREWRYGAPLWRQTFRSALGTNPIYWLARRDRLMSRLSALIMGSLFLVWILFFIGLGANVVMKPLRDEALMILIIVSFGLHLIFKCMVTLEASRRICEDFQSGALELLASTPVSNRQFMSGFRRALSELFFIPKLWLVVANIALALLILIRDPGGMNRDKYIFFWILLGGVVVLFTDFYALIWVSLRLALRGRRHHRVILSVLGRVMLPPWAAIFLFFFMIQHSNFSETTAKTFVFIWFLGSLALAFQGLAAWSALRTGFRPSLAERETKAGVSEAVLAEPELPITPAPKSLRLQS